MAGSCGPILKKCLHPFDPDGPITFEFAIPARFAVYRLSRSLCWSGFILGLS